MIRENLRNMSRSNITSKIETKDGYEIYPYEATNCGSFQRIADAVEQMAATAERTNNQSYTISRLERELKSLRKALTKLQKDFVSSKENNP